MLKMWVKIEQKSLKIDENFSKTWKKMSSVEN